MEREKSSIEYAEDREVWEQQPGETTKQYQRFIRYRDMGRMRSLRTLVKTLGELGDRIAYGSIKVTSCHNRWTERAHAWDLHQDEIDSVQILEARRTMVRQHQQVASALMAKAVEALRTTNPRDLGPDQIMRWIKLATDLQSRILGEPTQTIAVTGPTGGPIQTEDLTHLGDDERKARLRELAAEIASRAGLTTVATEDENE